MVDIIFEDNHILALNKPANLATQCSEDHKISLEDEAKAYIKEAYQKPGNVFLHPIHRLDRPTSGLVLFAKTSKALSRLQEMMRKQELTKVYVAIAEGHILPAEGTLEHRLCHDSHRASISPSGKPAILHYKVTGHVAEHSIVTVELVTGRYHQIRAQFQAIGHPLLGDKKYGGMHPFYKDFVALHHARLDLTHPVTHAQIELSAPLPDYWHMAPLAGKKRRSN